MIAAEDERQESGGEGFVHAAGQRLAGVGDQRQVLGARIALGPGFLLFDGYVAAVLHLIAERSHARVQAGDAYGGRSHIDAAAVLPEIERRADDGDVGAWHVVFSIVPRGCAVAGSVTRNSYIGWAGRPRKPET